MNDKAAVEAKLAQLGAEQAEFQANRPLMGLGSWSTAIEKGTIDWDEFIEKLEKALVRAKQLRDRET